MPKDVQVDITSFAFCSKDQKIMFVFYRALVDSSFIENLEDQKEKQEVSLMEIIDKINQVNFLDPSSPNYYREKH